MITASPAPHGGVGEGLLNSAGKDASDGVLAVQSGYGTIGPTSPKSKVPPEKSKVAQANGSPITADPETAKPPKPPSRSSSTTSQSTIASLPNQITRSSTGRGGVRSGSITENIVEAGGIRKVVLETTSSSEDADDVANGNGVGLADTKENNKPEEEGNGNGNEEQGKGGKKKRRRRRRKAGDSEDATPLLERGEE